MKSYFYLLVLLIPFFTYATEIPSLQTPIIIDATLSASWRSHDIVDEYDYWQIPGTLMGGNAWPVEKGTHVDETKLGLRSRLDQNFYAVIEVGTHTSGNDAHKTVELEHGSLGYFCCDTTTSSWALEVGRMTAKFSPSLNQHTSDRLSSEPPLIADIFFGRNFHDDGIRALWQNSTMIAGAEVWKGNAFPATPSGNEAWDIFTQYFFSRKHLNFSTGVWLYESSAESRSDHRYGGNHQHALVAPPGMSMANFVDVRFTGDTSIYGFHADISTFNETKSWDIGLKTELMALKMNGSLHDAAGRIASLDASQMGAWVQPYITWQNHTFGVRAEWLSADNKVRGAAAKQLSVDSGLDNPERFNPSRYNAIWLWKLRENMALRTELIEDKAHAKDKLRFYVGLIWTQILWPFKANPHYH